ncbi:conserved hypothetical protein [Pediculus humanus corporis]|uniref:Uncharacterized protein n=1 Tax=Pediculus humanus subsp. corporis TaxID=121224 RepID=E0W048_PEDHC|nr:uncharacterized protein Phum_PHUM545470 [Pediculus humanus corporis]EEB19004.1 conserved hypothetical protein [Pediculus humanus corporis]
MSKHGLALQSFTTELVNCLENLKTKREELQIIIDLEELEKAKLQAEIECLSNRLSVIMTSLTKKTAARADFDRAISESETALCRLLENSQLVVNNVRREISTLSGDEIMKTSATCPSGQTQFCLIDAPDACQQAVPPGGVVTGGGMPQPPVAVGITCRSANGL